MKIKNGKKIVFSIIFIVGILVVLNTYSLIKADEPILPPPPPPIPPTSPPTTPPIPHHTDLDNNTNVTYEIIPEVVDKEEKEEIYYYPTMRKDIRLFMR